MHQKHQLAKEKHAPQLTLQTEFHPNGVINDSRDHFELFEEEDQPSTPSTKLRRQSSRLLCAFKALKSDTTSRK